MILYRIKHHERVCLALRLCRRALRFDPKFSELSKPVIPLQSRPNSLRPNDFMTLYTPAGHPERQSFISPLMPRAKSHGIYGASPYIG
ncbi:hypothetical protein BC938DRAFT_471786 [Jimgerdemannia flammicorona]|uniref:Uncharacterized protein n=1 Tax=Jimgerdemannia flammicorona TaxID=994334 RepID=A0A433Q7D1_9FUNG|nr:hypothetical protein BC938DRAFT_471786 [Jimgerdemannia flammicorona]